jgi:hypothetical protein
MRKGIADLHRPPHVSQAANCRYLGAIASVEDTTFPGELTALPCQLAKRNGRRMRPLEPYAPSELDVISRGEFAINAFSNRDPRPLLLPTGLLTHAPSATRFGTSNYPPPLTP